MYEADDALTDLDQLRSRYEVLRRLGYDGDREVYAVRSKVGERHFAVGVLDRDAGAARPGALHLSQAHTIQPLSHPGLLPIHAVHHLQGGAVAVALERRRGRTIADRLRDDGPLPAQEAEAVLREIAEALAYLHTRGVVHRNVRPASVFLDRDDERARLSAFAIDSRPTARNAALRTAGATASRVGPTTDLLALGLVAYEMLAGRPAAPDHAHPPLAELRPDLPETLIAAIDGCLAPKGASRWRSAAELIAALDGSSPPRTVRALPGLAIAERLRGLTLSVTEEISVAAARWPALPALAAALSAALVVALATPPEDGRSRRPARSAAAVQAPPVRSAPTAERGSAPNPAESLPVDIEWQPAAEVALTAPPAARSPAAGRTSRQTDAPVVPTSARRPAPAEASPASPPSPFANGLVLLGEPVDP